MGKNKNFKSIFIMILQVLIHFSFIMLILNQWGLDFLNIFWNGVERLEIYCFSSVSVRRFWVWKMITFRYIFIASGYIFQASECFFQHPDTPCYINFVLRIFSMFSSFFPFDSLYSFFKPLLMFLGLISKHYLKIEIVFFSTWIIVSLLFAIFQLQVFGYSLPVSR